MQYKELDDKTQPYPDFGEILSTSIISSDTVATEKRKPRLAGRGLKVAEGNPATRNEHVPPSLAYSAINDNFQGILGAEMAMTYQPTGFVKIPRSLDAHPAFRKANAKYRYIFQELLKKAAWSPTCFYWNGNRVDIQMGQVYFSRKSLSTELNGEGEKDGWISENDIRGCIKYFIKSKFLTSALTSGLTNGPMIVTILYSEFSGEEKSLPNPSSHQRSNQHLTSASPTKEEDKEHKEEEKKKEKKKGTAGAAPSLSVLKIEKVKLRESVTLSQTEIDTAKGKFGDELFEAMCDCLNSYKISKGKVYKSDYGLFIRGGWLASAGRKLLQEEKAPTAQSDKNTPARQETLGNVLNDFELGSYYYSAKFGEFKLYSEQGYSVLSKSTSDLAGIRAGLKALKLERVRD